MIFLFYLKFEDSQEEMTYDKYKYAISVWFREAGQAGCNPLFCLSNTPSITLRDKSHPNLTL